MRFSQMTLQRKELYHRAPLKLMCPAKKPQYVHGINYAKVKIARSQIDIARYNFKRPRKHVSTIMPRNYRVALVCVLGIGSVPGTH
jgi:hypothetical protein